MAYPWPGFSTFLFEREEGPKLGSDTLWKRRTKRDQSANLGSSADSIVVLAAGSATREFELYLSPTRLSQLEALVSRTAEFCDWTRPAPDARQAFLAEIEPVEEVAVTCDDGTTQRKIRTRILLISQ